VPEPALRTTVVVPAHNAADTLGAQLDALARQETSEPFDVLVVDNASTDATAAVAASYDDRLRLRVVEAREGRGVAYARNAGARTASGRVLLFCDADDLVRPGWIEALTRALDGPDAADLAGGPVDVSRINEAAVVASVPVPPMDALPTTMRYLAYATGANLGVRAEVWEALGGFDETYVGGHEEVDFAWRAQLRGGRIAFVPGAVVDYRLRASLKEAMRQRYGYGRSYAQLYSRFRDQPIQRARARHEVRVVGGFLIEGPRALFSSRRNAWLTGLAWTLGRWRGGVAYRVRPPL